MKMKEEQFRLIQAQIKRLMGQGGFYSKKFAGIDPDSIQSQEDFEKLPFTWKGDLRDAYPLGLQAVPDEQVVRIHSSSGTTGTPVIIPYTKKDVSDWAFMFKRCYEMAALPRATASILRLVMDCGQPVLGFKPARSCWGRWRFRWGRAILKNSFV